MIEINDYYLYTNMSIYINFINQIRETRIDKMKKTYDHIQLNSYGDVRRENIIFRCNNGILIFVKSLCNPIS